MSTDSRYQAFVSYSSRDAPRVTAVADELKLRGVELWFDRDAIRDSDDIVRAIDQGLDGVNCFLIFLSAGYLESEWTQAEYSAIFYTALRDEQKIIVVRLDELSNVPPLLAARRAIRWTTAHEVAELAAAAIAGDIPHQTSAPASQDIQWNDLQVTLVDVLVTRFLEHQFDVVRSRALFLPVSVAVTPTTEITMYLATSIAGNEAIIEDLRAERDVARISKRLVNEYQKSLTQGGLGIFSPAFKIAMEESQERYDRSVTTMRDQMTAIAPRLTKRMIT